MITTITIIIIMDHLPAYSLKIKDIDAVFPGDGELCVGFPKLRGFVEI